MKTLIPFQQYLDDKRREAEESCRRAQEEAKSKPRVPLVIPPNIENPSGLACEQCGAELTEVIPGMSGSLTPGEAFFDCHACGKHHGRGPRTSSVGKFSLEWIRLA